MPGAVQAPTSGSCRQEGGNHRPPITYLALWVPVASVRAADFSSRRVGNYQYNPAAGILLDQLWLR